MIVGDYNSPRWTYEVPDCSMPMTFDQYNNCGYTCLYCFSANQRGLNRSGSESGKEYIAKKEIKAVDVNKIKKLFTNPDNDFKDYIEKRIVMQWGGLSDPFCPFEKEYGVGLVLLRFFREIDYPLCFSTKAVWWLDDERYTELFKNNPSWNVKISIITLDEHKSRVIEKGVPSSEKRILGLKKITDLNCGGATLRLRPFMIGISSPRHLELIERSADAGATALSTEFFCLDVRSKILKDRLKYISKLAGFSYTNFYKKYSVDVGYRRLNRNVKRPYMEDMKNKCDEVGMRFYASDAHFKELCNNGSCCGLSEDWNYSRGQFTEALLICKEKGVVYWDDISGDMGHLKNVQYRGNINSANSRKRAKFFNFSLYDYLRHLWNHPKHGLSPYKMFAGVMRPTKIDKNNNLIYVYDKRRE
jgi:DNA repair photolyase